MKHNCRVSVPDSVVRRHAQLLHGRANQGRMNFECVSVDMTCGVRKGQVVHGGGWNEMNMAMRYLEASDDQSDTFAYERLL